MSYYIVLHLPTGRELRKPFDAPVPHSRLELLELLNRWNRQGAGVWQYWLET